jgi:hypothetical protein
VLNPATVKLAPGTIIPKAVGSAGLTPLTAPGDFDTSQVVLDDLRKRISAALMADKLGQVNGPKMTATEVLERSSEMARLLGATYGRLQSELLAPLLTRLIAILARRGDIRAFRLDGRMADLDLRTPVGRYQTQNQAKSVIAWLDAIRPLGPEAMAAVDHEALARWMADAFGVPPFLIRDGGAARGGAGVPGEADGAANLTGALASVADSLSGVLPVPPTVAEPAPGAAPEEAPHDIG